MKILWNNKQELEHDFETALRFLYEVCKGLSKKEGKRLMDLINKGMDKRLNNWGVK